MVARVSPSIQDGLLKVLLAVSEGRGEDAAIAMLTISEKKDEFNERDFVRNVVDIVGRNKEASLTHLAVGRVVMQCSKIAADGGVRLPSELTTLGKTLMNLDQLGKALDPNFSPNESIRRNATSMIQRKIAGSMTPGNLLTGILEAKDFAQRLPGRVNKILDAVVNNDLSFKVETIDETRLMMAFQKVANRITAGLLLAAMIIGAALLTHVDSPGKVWGYPVLATTLFLMAAAGAVLLLVRILVYDE
jgi:predicted unusual protein kinase regulating ubiquinone biosynthesis (AarF/ABC1/UbiB family)